MRAGAGGGARFWLSAAAGWVLIAVGVGGIVVHRVDTRPGDLARFVVGGLLVHDLVVAPLVLAVAVGVARIVPGRARRPVQAALAVSGMLALFSYPLIRAYGTAANNPTSLPHNYAANLAVVLGVVWAVAAGVVLWRRRRCRSVRT